MVQRPGIAHRLAQHLQRVESDAPAEPTVAPTEHPLGLLVPEGPPLSFRPAVREALNADLPLLRDLEAAEQKARAGAVRLIEQEAAHHAAHVRLLACRLSPPAGDRKQPDRPAQTRFPERDPLVDDVVGLLGRPASPAEKVLIRHLRTSHTAEETAAALKHAGPSSSP